MTIGKKKLRSLCDQAIDDNTGRIFKEKASDHTKESLENTLMFASLDGYDDNELQMKRRFDRAVENFYHGWGCGLDDGEKPNE